MKDRMTTEQKGRLLEVLKGLREEYTGNVGGETDIRNADNMMVAEDEFTAAIKPERNAIAKTFDTKGDFDSYVNQRRGIEMTKKERDALMISEQAPAPAMAAKPATPSNQPAPAAPQEPEGEEDVTVDDTIRITKSITFIDETDGANILSDLIEKLELHKAQPTYQDKFLIKYEVTDDFGDNDTTVIKKLKEGNQFCWTAFSKHETAEEEGKPEGGGI